MKSLKAYKENFPIYPTSITSSWKDKFINWHENFKLQDQCTSSVRSQKHPGLAGSWVQELSSVWMQWKNMLERVKKKSIRRCSGELGLSVHVLQSRESWQGSSSAPIKDPDKVKTHTSWHGKMCCDVPVMREQDRRGTWILWAYWTICLLRLWSHKFWN